MKNSSRFFCNRECEYFPCHPTKDTEDFNCMFCFCPLYRFDDCPGNKKYIMTGDGKKIKDCSECLFPHREKNYDAIMERLK
ncbi:MAG: cysteine-rich small domain-containing protein [Lachnospiraceae bacterium]|nr:cysteine-rich small domain-containing protein [Lachnospiraceae bacterium]